MKEAVSRILIVDDEEPIRRLMAEYLSSNGYAVATAENGQEALAYLDDQPVDLILTDLRMPQLSGMELLGHVARGQHETAVILLTGCDDVPAAVEAMKLGADDYLMKTSGLRTVGVAVGAALQRREDRLASKLAATEAATELRRFRERLEDANSETLELLVAVLDARERETLCHSRRVSAFAKHLGASMGMEGEELETLRKGALLHDVGKVGIPDAILCKPAGLTEDEREQMRKHPQIGYRILQAVETLRPAAMIVLAHHANYDGTGYPMHWHGDRIPLGARIFSVVDSYDAMTSDRPYRTKLSYAEALAELRRCAGTQFDPAVVDAFARIPAAEWEQLCNAMECSPLPSSLPFD